MVTARIVSTREALKWMATIRVFRVAIVQQPTAGILDMVRVTRWKRPYDAHCLQSNSFFYFYRLSWILIVCPFAAFCIGVGNYWRWRWRRRWRAKTELNSLALNLESSFSTVCVYFIFITTRYFGISFDTSTNARPDTLVVVRLVAAKRWNPN